MVSLKLGKLPDRETTKITFTASAELNKLLTTYASAYEAEYGLRESITDIIPHMLEAFIKTDRGFQKSSRTSAVSADAVFQTTNANDGN